MYGIYVLHQSGEAFVEDIHPWELAERLLCHGLTGDVSVLADIIKDVIQILLLLRRQHLALDEFDILLLCQIAVDANHRAQESGYMSAIEFVALLAQIGLFVFLLRTQFLPEDALQFTNIRFGELLQLVNLLQYRRLDILLQITLKPTAGGKKILFIANTLHYTCNRRCYRCMLFINHFTSPYPIPPRLFVCCIIYNNQSNPFHLYHNGGLVRDY